MHGARDGPWAAAPALNRADPLLAAVSRARSIPHRQDILRHGEVPGVAHVLLDGHTCRYQLLRNGHRQITAILVPGDLCDLEAVLRGRADYGVAALTPCTVGEIPLAAIHEPREPGAGIARALWQHVLRDEAIAREWLVNIGRRPALERVAHLFCELRARLEGVGLASADGFEMNLTQAELADALGLTGVHINRVIRSLRQGGLIRMDGPRLTILDRPALEALAGFDPAYLRTA